MRSGTKRVDNVRPSDKNEWRTCAAATDSLCDICKHILFRAYGSQRILTFNFGAIQILLLTYLLTYIVIKIKPCSREHKICSLPSI